MSKCLWKCNKCYAEFEIDQLLELMKKLDAQILRYRDHYDSHDAIDRMSELLKELQLSHYGYLMNEG